MFEKPLAELLRPETLEQVVGQEHLTAPGNVLHRMVAQKKLQSMILWGGPGTGKTTLASILAQSAQLPFAVISAVQAGVKEVKDVIARTQLEGKIVLFIDEIHRFNKSQQDALLGAVEQGKIVLIGATTENPSFEVNSALLSRCQVFTLQALTAEHLRQILQRALQYLHQQHDLKVEIAEDDLLLLYSGGDVRKLLNMLELLLMHAHEKKLVIDNALIQSVASTKMALYDKAGEQHYDIISAFIKSIRGSDPNAAVYWLARLLHGGEDVKFIARRLLILAAEDVGLANPNALLLANACFDAVHKIGMPEARIILSETAIYLATSPKSNSAYKAIDAALNLVAKTGDLPVPLHIRNAPTQLLKELQYGKGYQYAHDYHNNFVNQEYLPEKISGTVLYQPGKNRREDEIAQNIRNLWQEKYASG